MVKKRWLITGGCGFIGGNLINHILKEIPHDNITILDDLSVGTKEDLGEVCDFREAGEAESNSRSSQVELLIGDIRDFKSCLNACKGIDLVVHLAANTGVAPSVENPGKDMENNVIGTFNMLEASRQSGVKTFVFASSGAPLGEVDPPIHEEKAPKPVSPYGASKLAGEGYCSAYYRTFGLKTVSLRFGNVYGPRSKHKSSVVAKFFKEAFAGKTLEIYGDGKQTRDFIYIDDLIQAITLSVKADIGGEVFQIATHKETTVNEIAEKVKKIVEKESDQKIDIVYGKSRVGDVERNFSDISKAKKMLGYEPIFDLNKGLKHTFEYFRKMAKWL